MRLEDIVAKECHQCGSKTYVIDEHGNVYCTDCYTQVGFYNSMWNEKEVDNFITSIQNLQETLDDHKRMWKEMWSLINDILFKTKDRWVEQVIREWAEIEGLTLDHE